MHAGYAKRRLDLLRAGVRLFELKRSAGDAAPTATRGSGGSSSASLHAKTFAIDRARVFVGSFNFDPRSALLNTEMGLLIESPVLARRLCKGIDDLVREPSYEVRLAPDGSRVEWIESAPSGNRRHVTEPGIGFLARSAVKLLSFLPIEWLL